GDEGFGVEGDEYDSDAEKEVKVEEATSKKEATPPQINLRFQCGCFGKESNFMVLQLCEEPMSKWKVH
nr:hypothetical protein [Tanacetum cinerariifolium]